MAIPIKILHIEDDPLYASLMQAILMDGSGLDRYDIVHVASLKKALSQLQGQGFGAVLLDLSLDDTSGLDNVRAIKQENPDLPIIVVSGLDSEDVAVKALDEGAQDYIIKGHANHKVIRLAIKNSIRRKAMERDLYYEANYDDLTGLVNRRHFSSHLQHALDRAKRWGHHVTVLFIDLDRFKHINDTYGHAAGNALLREAGNRVTSILRATDIVARYGGDEFVVLLDDQNKDQKYASAQIVAKIQNAFNAPLNWEGHTIDFSASIGVAIYPESGTTPAQILANADKAMYEAKKHGGRHFRFADLSAEKQ